jgi:hypothetical protein
MQSLEKLMKYKPKEPKYLLDAFAYADEYADGLFMKGAGYGFVLGIIATLVVLVLVV